MTRAYIKKGTFATAAELLEHKKEQQRKWNLKYYKRQREMIEQFKKIESDK